jgi:hypothetical protein
MFQHAPFDVVEKLRSQEAKSKRGTKLGCTARDTRNNFFNVITNNEINKKPSRNESEREKELQLSAQDIDSGAVVVKRSNFSTLLLSLCVYFYTRPHTKAEQNCFYDIKRE